MIPVAVFRVSFEFNIHKERLTGRSKNSSHFILFPPTYVLYIYIYISAAINPVRQPLLLPFSGHKYSTSIIYQPTGAVDQCGCGVDLLKKLSPVHNNYCGNVFSMRVYTIIIMHVDIPTITVIFKYHKLCIKLRLKKIYEPGPQV